MNYTMPLTPTNYLFLTQYIYYIQNPPECVDILSSHQIFLAGALEARVRTMIAFRPPAGISEWTSMSHGNIKFQIATVGTYGCIINLHLVQQGCIFHQALYYYFRQNLLNESYTNKSVDSIV